MCVVYAQATLFALDALRDAMPELALGAELRDSCWAPHTALRQAIRLALPPRACHKHTHTSLLVPTYITTVIQPQQLLILRAG